MSRFIRIGSWALLLLFGCETHSKWHCQTITEKQSEATCIFYQSQDPILGIDLEILSSKDHFTTYLQVHSYIPYSKDLPGKTEVILSTPHKTIKFLADIHEGQQRLRLPEEVQAEFLSMLQEEDSLTIELVNFKEIVETQEFKESLKFKPSILKKIISSFSPS